MTATEGESVQQIRLDEFLQAFAPVSGHSWQDERTWLEENHPRRVARLRRLIAVEGIEDPIRVCFSSHQVVDGHHRVIVAQDLGIELVPVANAWEKGADWMYYADDNPGDDPIRPAAAVPAPDRCSHCGYPDEDGLQDNDCGDRWCGDCTKTFAEANDDNAEWRSYQYS